MKINYKKFIEDNFMVKDRESQQFIPFRFNEVQDKYYEMLTDKYVNYEGVREIILKADRKSVV